MSHQHYWERFELRHARHIMHYDGDSVCCWHYVEDGPVWYVGYRCAGCREVGYAA
jgi:hypothetical protein